MFNDEPSSASSSSSNSSSRRGSGLLNLNNNQNQNNSNAFASSKKGRIVRRVSKTLDEEELKNFQLKYAEFTTTPSSSSSPSAPPPPPTTTAPTTTTTTTTTPEAPPPPTTPTTTTTTKPVTTPMKKRNENMTTTTTTTTTTSSNSPSLQTPPPPPPTTTTKTTSQPPATKTSASASASTTAPVLCYVLNPIQSILKEPLIFFDYDDLKSITQKLLGVDSRLQQQQQNNNDEEKKKSSTTPYYKEFTTIHAAYEYVQQQQQQQRRTTTTNVVVSTSSSSKEGRKQKQYDEEEEEMKEKPSDPKDENNEDDGRMDVEDAVVDQKKNENEACATDAAPNSQTQEEAAEASATEEDHVDVAGGRQQQQQQHISPPHVTMAGTDKDKSVDMDEDDGGEEEEGIDEEAAAAADGCAKTDEAADHKMEGESDDGICDDDAAAAAGVAPTTATNHKPTASSTEEKNLDDKGDDDVAQVDDKGDKEAAGDDEEANDAERDEELQDIFKAAYAYKGNTRRSTKRVAFACHRRSNKKNNDNDTAGLYDDADEDPSYGAAEMENEACPEDCRSLSSSQDDRKKSADDNSSPSVHEHSQIADIMLAFKQQEKEPGAEEDDPMDSSSPSSSEEGEPASTMARRDQPSNTSVGQQKDNETGVEGEEPGPYDVLCGKRWEQYAGNVRFRKLVLERSLEMYEKTSDRSSSGTLFDLATMVVSNVQTHPEHPVRFLKCTNVGRRDTGPWSKVEDKEAAWFVYYELLKLRSNTNNRNKMSSLLASNLTASRLGQGGIPFQAAAGTALRQGLGGGLLTSSVLGHADMRALWTARQNLEAAGIRAGGGGIIAAGGGSSSHNPVAVGQDILRQPRSVSSLAGNPTGSFLRSPYSRIGSQTSSARYPEAGQNPPPEPSTAADVEQKRRRDSTSSLPPSVHTHETLSQLSAAFVAKNHAAEQKRRRVSTSSIPMSAHTHETLSQLSAAYAAKRNNAAEQKRRVSASSIPLSAHTHETLSQLSAAYAAKRNHAAEQKRRHSSSSLTPLVQTHETLSQLSAAYAAKKNQPQQKRRDSSRSSFSKSAEHVKKVMLPQDFTPTPYSVICGRGKKCAEFIGNRRLKVMATMFVARYNHAHTKEDKSVIVSEILEMVQDACPDKTMAFVRFDNGQWWSEDTSNAREKIGTVLRDCLSDKYNSSTKSKCQRRREKREAAKKGVPPSLKNAPLDQRSCPPK